MKQFTKFIQKKEAIIHLVPVRVQKMLQDLKPTAYEGQVANNFKEQLTIAIQVSFTIT